MKQCSKCKEWKDIDTGFHNDKSRKDGKREECKKCALDRIKKYRQTEQGKNALNQYRKSEQRKIAYIKYNNTPKSKEARRRYIGSEKSKQITRKFRQDNPEKLKARNAISNKIRSGKMPSPLTLKCNNCGNQAMGYHHYMGYAKEHRLDVIPLCHICHRKADKAMKNNQKTLQ